MGDGGKCQQGSATAAEAARSSTGKLTVPRRRLKGLRNDTKCRDTLLLSQTTDYRIS